MITYLKLLTSLILTTALIPLQAQILETSPTYHSIGIKVNVISNADSCTIAYKEQSQSIWLEGYPADRITVSGIDQFRGSVFLLQENSVYDIRVTVFDQANATVLEAQQNTLAAPSFAPTATIKWVSPNGTGDYTQSNPGDISTLFSSGQVLCGTTILLTDGLYKQNGFQLNLSTDCTANTPIILMAAPGAHPVFDAGIEISTEWTPHPMDANLYATAIPAEAAHSNICLLGNTAIYPYPSLTAELLLGGYHLANLSFGYDGFVRDENVIWIKTQAGINPNDSTVIVSTGFRFLTVYGNNKDAFLKIKGITFRYFGRPIVNPLGSAQDAYSATVFDLRNVHQVYVDSCTFLYNTNHLSFGDQCDHLTIQNSSFKHDVGKWSHAMIKKSHDFVHSIFFTVSSSRGRAVESPAIFLDRGKSVVIRNNYFNGLNSGVESYFDQGFKEEVDIYNNVFVDNFDAIECDGLWSNLRVWNNEIIRPMAGISAAPPLIGPRYFYRNVFHGMKGRRNESDDPYFIGCAPVNGNYRSQGIGIKTNSGYEGAVPPGNLYFFNNTFHAEDTLGFVFSSWQAEWRKAVFINNSYSHQVSHPFFYFDLSDEVVNGDFQVTSIQENYFSFNAAAPIAIAKHIHGQYLCSDVMDVADLQSTLSDISGSPNIMIQNPSQNNPAFNSMAIGGFELNNNSPLIDAGVLIPGFYDYVGAFPDIGAKEKTSIVNSPEVDKATTALRIYPNPSTGLVYFSAPEDLHKVQVEVYNAYGQRLMRVGDFDLAEALDLSRVAEGVYFILVDAGGGRSCFRVLKIGG
jgi:Secretion system C-terminal sorting domain